MQKTRTFTVEVVDEPALTETALLEVVDEVFEVVAVEEEL